MTGIGEALLISAAASLASAGISYALTPTQKIEKGRLNSLVSGSSSYGSPLPWAWGTVRLPGNKIWLDYLEKQKKKSKQGGKGAKLETTENTYYGYWAEAYCQCPFRPIVDFQRHWMNKKLVYSTIGGAETIKEGGAFAEQYLRFYKGEPAQAIDPLLSNKQPISSYTYGIPTNKSERDAFLRAYGIDPRTAILTPGYNYQAYMVGSRVPIRDFANAIPTGEAEIIASINCSVAQIVGDIFSLFYQPERYDVSLLSTPVNGFTIDNVEEAKNAIQTLQQAYFFDVVKSNGVYKFIPLNHPRDVINLQVTDLAAHTGKQKPVDYEIIEADPASLPSLVTVSYIDPDLNYDVNTQESGLEVKKHYNPNPVQLSFNLVLTASEAATIADRALILAWVAKYTYKFKLPPAYLDLEPADLIANVFDDRPLPIRLTKLRLGANYILDCEGTAHEVFFWNLVRQLESGAVTLGIADYNVILEVSGTPTAVADNQGNVYIEGTDYTVNESGNIQVIESGNISPGTELVVSTTKPPEPDSATVGKIASPGNTELLVLDIPLISDDDSDYTLYLTGGGGDDWNGASIHVSVDNSRYIFATNLSTYGIYGTCQTLLNESTSSLTVSINAPELESMNNSDLELGLNLALVGSEIIQFKTAELIDTNTYMLSNLRRGLRGTENFKDSHATGERFVLLTGDGASLASIIATAADIGEIRYFKAVSTGQSISEVQPVQVSYQGIAQRPYAPVNLAAAKNAVGDITITWDRRDRHDQKNNPPILSEDQEQYVVQIKNLEGKVRDITTNTNSHTYLATEQTSDFGSIQSTITVDLAQVSSSFGNGTFATATLTPSLDEPVPTITSFSPSAATIGAIITVTGTNLASVSAVAIDTTQQNNLAVINNQTIEFAIAPGTVTGKIEVTTTGGSATSSDTLIVEQPEIATGFPMGSKTITLPYLITASDFNLELIIAAESGIIQIPDSATGFAAYWGCWISLDGTGTVTITRENGRTTNILQSNSLGNNDTVKLWHRSANVWKVD